MSSYKRYMTVLSLALPLAVAVPSALSAQGAAPAAAPAAAAPAQMPEVNDQKLQAYVKAFLAERRVQDEFDPQLAAVKNKQDEIQKELREQRRTAMAKVYTDNGMTEQEFNWITFVVSSNQERREAFEKMLEAAKNGTTTP
jgi:alkylhydroperoxidase/carboxymuconolactone decarboxylase family protein YurZ